MNFVKANALNRTGLAVGKDHGLADKPGLGSLELTEDRACVLLHGWHDGVPQTGGSLNWLVSENRGSRDDRAAKVCRLSTESVGAWPREAFGRHSQPNDELKRLPCDIGLGLYGRGARCTFLGAESSDLDRTCRTTRSEYFEGLGLILTTSLVSYVHGPTSLVERERAIDC
jgi:hypothetical protein